MKRTFTAALLVGLLGLLAVTPVGFAQQGTFYTDKVQPSTEAGGSAATTSLKLGPTAAPLEILSTGEPSLTTAHTDGFVFLPAWKICRSDTATQQNGLIPVRVAASDWALARTASGNESIIITCDLNSWLQRSGGTKGVKINSLTIVHQITTQALTGATWGKLATRVFANNTANGIGTDLATAPTLPLAVQANPYVTAVAIPTAKYLPINSSQDLQLEFSLTLANTVYRLYGIGVTYSRLDH